MAVVVGRTAEVAVRLRVWCACVSFLTAGVFQDRLFGFSSIAASERVVLVLEDSAERTSGVGQRGKNGASLNSTSSSSLKPALRSAGRSVIEDASVRGGDVEKDADREKGKATSKQSASNSKSFAVTDQSEHVSVNALVDEVQLAVVGDEGSQLAGNSSDAIGEKSVHPSKGYVAKSELAAVDTVRNVSEATMSDNQFVSVVTENASQTGRTENVIRNVGNALKSRVSAPKQSAITDDGCVSKRVPSDGSQSVAVEDVSVEDCPAISAVVANSLSRSLSVDARRSESKNSEEHEAAVSSLKPLLQTTSVGQQAVSNALFLLSDLYERFGDCCVRVRYQQADGKTQVASGFFVSDKGHVLTPVIGGSDFYVETRSYRKFSAKKCGEDPVSSLCLLQADIGDQSVSYFSLLRNSDWPKIGQSIVSLSCKLGQSISPQIGYVTAFSERYFATEFPFVFVRSSLRIDGGDCGGAVLDMHGNLLGMLFHALPDTQETFYMPSWGLERLFQDLLLFGNVRYGYAGLSVRSMYDPKTHMIRLQVQTVQSNSPAEHSGFKVNDVLLELNGSEVGSIEMFKNFIFLSKPDDVLRCTVMRGRQTLTLVLRLSEKR